MKIGRFVKILIKRIQACCKEIVLSIPKTLCNDSKKTTKRKEDDSEGKKEHVMDEDDRNVQEKLIKKKKKPKLISKPNLSISIKKLL